MRRAATCIGLLTLSVGAYAWPTSLNLIPVADILRHREAFAMYSVFGTNLDKTYVHGNSLTVGLFDRIELGYDNDFLGTTTYNAKLLLLDGIKQMPNLQFSVGCTSGSFNSDYREPYAVASYGLNNATLHAGYWRTGGVNRGMFGADFMIGSEEWLGMVETLTGPNGYTYVGLCYSPAKISGLSLVLTLGVPHQKEDGTIRSFCILYAFKF